jgi:hypothetical protein
MFNRDILAVFKTVTNADGHPSAFGVTILEDKLKEIIVNVDLMIGQIDKSKDIIEVNWNTYNDDQGAVQQDINLMMQYNEYCLQPYPEAYAVLTTDKTMTITQRGRAMYIKWCGRNIILAGGYVKYGDTVLIKPTIDKDGYKLMASVLKV